MALELNKNSLGVTPKAQSIRENIDKLDFIKIKIFNFKICSLKFLNTLKSAF